MEKNQKEELILLVDNLIKQVQLILKLIAKEARLAAYSLKAIILITILSVLVIVSTWFTLLFFIGYEVYVYSQNVAYSILVVLLVNMVIYLFLKLMSKFLRGNLLFKATRRHILSVGSKDVA